MSRPQYGVYNCYNMGSVSVGLGQAGGIVGNCETKDIYNCYNAGSVSYSTKTSYVGGIVGFVGLNVKLTIHDSYSISSVYGSKASSPTVTLDNSNSCSLDTLKTCADKLGDAFVEDTENINNGYPVLLWQTK